MRSNSGEDEAEICAAYVALIKPDFFLMMARLRRGLRRRLCGSARVPSARR